MVVRVCGVSNVGVFFRCIQLYCLVIAGCCKDGHAATRLSDASSSLLDSKPWQHAWYCQGFYTDVSLDVPTTIHSIKKRLVAPCGAH